MIFSAERTGFLGQGRRGAGQPAVGNRVFQRFICDFRNWMKTAEYPSKVAIFVPLLSPARERR
jgi:hypothetical protein